MRRDLIKSAMNTTSKKSEVGSTLAKLSRVDPQPHRNKPRKRRTKTHYKMWNKKAGRFEYGTRY